MIQKLFEEEMLIRHLPKNPLQIFFKFMINLKVVLESIIGPDDTCHGDLRA